MARWKTILYWWIDTDVISDTIRRHCQIYFVWTVGFHLQTRQLKTALVDAWNERFINNQWKKFMSKLIQQDEMYFHKYSGTPLYGHKLNANTCLLRTMCCVCPDEKLTLSSLALAA